MSAAVMRSCNRCQRPATYSRRNPAGKLRWYCDEHRPGASRLCDTCGACFAVPVGNDRRRFCSVACSASAKRARRLDRVRQENILCQHCGEGLATRPKGLCLHCYEDPEVRCLYRADPRGIQGLPDSQVVLPYGPGSRDTSMPPEKPGVPPPEAPPLLGAWDLGLLERRRAVAERVLGGGFRLGETLECPGHGRGGKKPPCCDRAGKE